MKCEECDSALNTLKNHCHEPNPLTDIELLSQLAKIVLGAEREVTARRLENWLEQDNQLIYHDSTCNKRIKENQYEWNCECFLNEIVQRIKDGA